MLLTHLFQRCKFYLYTVIYKVIMQRIRLYYTQLCCDLLSKSYFGISITTHSASIRSRRLPMLTPHFFIVLSALVTRCCTFAQTSSCLLLAIPILFNLPVILSFRESVFENICHFNSFMYIYNYGSNNNNMARPYGALLLLRGRYAPCIKVACGGGIYCVPACIAFYRGLSQP